MKKQLARGLVALMAAMAALVAASPGEAQAVTWIRTAKTTHNAYSWNGYKANLAPSATPPVSGYTVIDRRITVKNSAGQTLASNVTSRWTAPGNYTVYSTYKYRKATPYTATKTVSYNVDYDTLNSCTITGYFDDGGGYTWTVNATCNVTLENFTGAGASVTRTIAIQGQYLGYEPPTVGMQTTDIYDYEASLPSTFSKTVSYTAYRYSYYNLYRVRTASVVKVTNYGTVTWTEYTTVQAPWDGGDSLARVRSIFGSNGTRISFMESGGKTYAGYQWRNTSGGYVYVTFEDNLAYTKTWYS